ncbi:hypothetical protein ASF82_05385 [Frigoribacterium sp. Leaf164]|uniref:lipocalin-like domain-containing protein n=1 Tax=unclassified Frigoribacterium TaxID=2627005 RepID=UPI0006F50E14|nr:MULTISPECIES: lipocalin-like domain-containing protein [unclassified Frigoribacterium]KQR46839.1 hypothetical protein ASF82_05385 [Frigoribacterium sp. Leaf164]MBD8728130.1 lipocalin-like domain-containing protein [Frigoribacterium sp. CFBP 13707]
MNTTHRTTSIALALIAVGAAVTGCTSTTADAGDATVTTSATAPTSSLTGEWEMTSLEVGTDGDLAEIPYGGQVIFTDAGTMAVQAANPDTAAPDGPYTVNGYEAFYGEVTLVDDDSFTVEVESALARDLIGQSLARDFDIDGDTLVLTPTDPTEGFRATYERQG